MTSPVQSLAPPAALDRRPARFGCCPVHVGLIAAHQARRLRGAGETKSPENCQPIVSPASRQRAAVARFKRIFDGELMPSRCSTYMPCRHVVDRYSTCYVPVLRTRNIHKEAAQGKPTNLMPVMGLLPLTFLAFLIPGITSLRKSNENVSSRAVFSGMP